MQWNNSEFSCRYTGRIHWCVPWLLLHNLHRGLCLYGPHHCCFGEEFKKEDSEQYPTMSLQVLCTQDEVIPHGAEQDRTSQHP